ncbi:MAG TPA: hypothetical protein VH724_14245 [Candidatus Angelobacter sp.]|jgi:hypothetical protein|nr:hypothetical protein [Candidatus Angelobacter sp.]
MPGYEGRIMRFCGSSFTRISGMLPGMDNRDTRSVSDVGGTPGGLGEFALGFIMTCVGGYLISNQVTVMGSYWSFWGANSFGVTLIPLLFGVGILFFNGRSTIGWVLTVGGALFILAGVIANMQIYFRPSSLFNTLIMLVLLVGGLGLIARSLRSHRKEA